MTRFADRTEKYNLILRKYVPNIECNANRVKYGDRILFIKKAKVNFFEKDIPLNCYICLDIQKQGIDRFNYYRNTSTKKTDEDIMYDSLSHGVFILISSIDLEPNNVLPCYYDRQIIEQIFDYMKNYIDIIPLRTHSEETLAGHLLISFIASIIYISLDKLIKNMVIHLILHLRH
jgi:transposase